MFSLLVHPTNLREANNIPTDPIAPVRHSGLPNAIVRIESR